MEKVGNENIGKRASNNVETHRTVAITTEGFVCKSVAATFPSEIISCLDIAITAHQSSPKFDGEDIVRIEDGENLTSRGLNIVHSRLRVI